VNNEKCVQQKSKHLLEKSVSLLRVANNFYRKKILGSERSEKFIHFTRMFFSQFFSPAIKPVVKVLQFFQKHRLKMRNKSADGT